MTTNEWICYIGGVASGVIASPFLRALGSVFIKIFKNAKNR